MKPEESAITTDVVLDFMFRLGQAYLASGEQTVQVFARWGLADGGVANIENYAQVGIGLRGLMGDPSDMAGLAFSYAFPTASSARDEKVVEVFYRWQLTSFARFSLGAQSIFDPGNGPSHDVVGAFWGRLRIVI